MVSNDWDSTLEPPLGIYQLRGGIQRYLEQYGTSDEDSPCLFKGKNFVFDPRRTDPLSSREIAGRCMICKDLHDDYDNGHAPCENKEARCCRCRVLVLVCNNCRVKVRAWGEDDKDETLPFLYCGGGTECVDQGNSAEQAVLLDT
jgi:predicted sulfurtransferase